MPYGHLMSVWLAYFLPIYFTIKFIFATIKFIFAIIYGYY